MKKIILLVSFLLVGLGTSFAKSTTSTKHNIKYVAPKSEVKSKQVVQDCIFILTVRMTDTFSITVRGYGDTCAAAEQNAITTAGQVIDALKFAASLA
ncbi:hypothetical protein ACVW0P_002259 [Mucilaginibacter sp. UYNi724]